MRRPDYAVRQALTARDNCSTAARYSGKRRAGSVWGIADGRSSARMSATTRSDTPAMRAPSRVVFILLDEWTPERRATFRRSAPNAAADSLTSPATAFGLAPDSMYASRRWR